MDRRGVVSDRECRIYAHTRIFAKTIDGARKVVPKFGGKFIAGGREERKHRDTRKEVSCEALIPKVMNSSFSISLANSRLTRVATSYTRAE